MTGPGRPLSLVVLSNSVGAIVAPPRRSRHERTYGEWTRDLLHDSGIATTLHLEARWAGYLRDARRDMEARVRAHAPDVVVVNFGVHESLPWVMPRALMNHLVLRWEPTTRTSALWRVRVVDPVRPAVRAYRSRAAGLVGARLTQAGPYRFRATLADLVRIVRVQMQALVLVCDLAPSAGRLEARLPRQGERTEVFQRAIRGVVAAFDDPDVRLVEMSRLCQEQGLPGSLPDGLHLSAAAHGALGALLAEQISGWWRAQDC